MVARSEESDTASHAMIWMGVASPPRCGVAGVRGRQRSAISVSAWDGPSRRAAHAWSGLGVRSERYMCGCVRRAAMSRRAATARSGIFGWTIRDPSCLPLDGRRNSADPRLNLRGEAVRIQRCEMRAAATAGGLRARAFRALGLWDVCLAHLGMGAIRWLESDLRSGQRREHRPNFAALVLRRVVASGRFFRRRPLGMVTRVLKVLACFFASWT